MLVGWDEQAFEADFLSATILGRRIFLFNSPEAVKFVLANPRSNFDRKNAQSRHSLLPLMGNSTFLSEGERWRQRRRAVAPAIHVSHLAEFVPVMVEAAMEMREGLTDASPSGEIDMLPTMAHLTLRIIWRTLFGVDVAPKDAATVVRGFFDYQSHIIKIDWLSLFGLPDWLPRWYARPVRRAARQVRSVVDRAIERSAHAPAKKSPTIVDRLRDTRRADNPGLDGEALREEIATIFTAGQETTANLLAWVWYLLSQASAVEARLHEEVDRVLGLRPPNLEDVAKLVYTRAIVEETMRLYPPVPILARDAIDDDSFDGAPIPKGSIALVAPWLLHRHKKLWRDPDHFRPERFLPGSDEPISKFAYIPFGGGARVCAGMGFGLTEAILCVATIAQRLQFRLRAEHQIALDCRLSLRPGATLPMSVHRRGCSPVTSPRAPMSTSRATSPRA